MSAPTVDEIARWAAEHHGWTPEDYPDSGEFCVECGEHMPCPTTRLLALVAAQAERIAELRGDCDRMAMIVDTNRHMRKSAEAELHALHATDDYQRWARAVVERDAAREAVGRVRAVIDPMHEDWCRAKSDTRPDRECECIRADVLAALDGGAAT